MINRTTENPWAAMAAQSLSVTGNVGGTRRVSLPVVPERVEVCAPQQHLAPLGVDDQLALGLQR